MDAGELLKRVRKIEIKTKGLSNQLFTGQYHSAFKGRGMTFSEVREYQYGDEIRTIDWNVTARFNHPYVKVFEEERELTVMLLVDVTASTLLGTKKQTKNELIAEIAGVLAFSAITNNDKAGLILFSDKIEKYIPPKKGRSHILRMIREIINFETAPSKTDIAIALSYLNNVQKKRTTAFVISDFISSDFTKELGLAGKKHKLFGVHITDANDGRLPEVGLLNIIDPETGESGWVDTTNKKVRAAYIHKWDTYFKKLTQSFLKSGVDVAEIKTTGSYIVPLMNLFNRV